MKSIVLGVMLALVLAMPAPASAAPPVELPPGVEVEGDVGDVSVVSALDTNEVVDRGNGFTVFTLAMPPEATCPGDSANDQWRVQTFMVPAIDDPIKLMYGAVGPEPWDGGERFAMYGTDTVPIVDQLLAKNSASGSPGTILPFAPMSFNVVSVQSLPQVEYRVGVACTYFGVTTRYWDALITLTKTGDDPDEFTWRLSSAPVEVPKDSSGSRRTWSLVVGALVLVVAAVGGWSIARKGVRRSSQEAHT